MHGQPPEHHLALDNQEGFLPNLNNNPELEIQEEEQQMEDQDMEGFEEEQLIDILLEEAQALHEEEEPQMELDLHLNLSPPPIASPSPSLGDPPLPLIVYNTGIPQAIVQEPLEPPAHIMGQQLDIHAQHMGAQQGNMDIHQEVVLGLLAMNQGEQLFGQNQAQEG